MKERGFCDCNIGLSASTLVPSVPKVMALMVNDRFDVMVEWKRVVMNIEL